MRSASLTQVVKGKNTAAFLSHNIFDSQTALFGGNGQT